MFVKPFLFSTRTCDRTTGTVPGPPWLHVMSSPKVSPFPGGLRRLSWGSRQGHAKLQAAEAMRLGEGGSCAHLRCPALSLSQLPYFRE